MTAEQIKAAGGPADLRGEFAKGWKVLLAATLGVMCGASPIPYAIVGFTAKPLKEEFGWSQTEAVLPITIFGVIAALLAPLFGWMADRFGVRPVALWSLFGFAAAFGAISLTPSNDGGLAMSVYYGFWVLLGLIGIGSTPVTWSRAINLWFYRNRGLALGIMLTGTSFTAMLIPQVAVRIIEAFGWRSMFAVLALLPIAALIIAYFLFREPSREERPRAIEGTSGNLTGVTLGTALKDYRFWLIWASIALIALSFGGAYINMATIVDQRGIDARGAASVITVLAIGIFAGRIITGALLDQFWQGFVAFPLLCLPAISAFLLLDPELTLVLAMAAGFFLGFAAGAESDLIAYLTGRYFGMAHYGKIYGMLYMPFGLFSAGSPVVYALTFDRTGSFDPVLELAIGAFIIGGALLLLLGRYPDDFPEAETDRPEAGMEPA
ncbi:MFS transporter [Erythrobacter sp.]|uniref:MFS transporter n=1 Tax=Erythrobacter sp. TaxID=1042 RepID=UPI0025F8AD1D|nr:MFS transporter [Erythrobacter sp.]